MLLSYDLELDCLYFLSHYIIQPLIAMAGFALMAVSGYVFVRNTKALLKAENINEWNFKQVYSIIRNKDTSRQTK